MPEVQWARNRFKELAPMTVLIERPSYAGVDTRTWTKACRLDALLPGRGAAVLLPNGEQAALFLLTDGTLAAVSNIDPFGRAAVMSRGITGDRRGEPTVASPLLKQVFSLRDGRCLDDESRALTLYDVRVTDGIVEIACR
jgi:nitrite reductase (NADH) small subunit